MRLRPMRRLLAAGLLLTTGLIPLPAGQTAKAAGLANATLGYSLPSGYGRYHTQDFVYRITAGAGTLSLTADRRPPYTTDLFAVAVTDSEGHAVGEAKLTTAALTAAIALPATGAYDVRMRPLFEPEPDSYSRPTFTISAPDLHLAHESMECISLTDSPEYAQVLSQTDLDVAPCSNAAFISRIALGDQVLWQSDAPDGGEHHHVTLNPATLADGVYRLQVEATQNGSSNRSLTTRTFQVDRIGHYRDVPQSHWARQAVELMTDLGIVNGRDEGQFAPDQPVLRKEFAKLLALTYGLTARPGEPSPFADAPNDWSQPYIDALY